MRVVVICERGDQAADESFGVELGALPIANDNHSPLALRHECAGFEPIGEITARLLRRIAGGDGGEDHSPSSILAASPLSSEE